jgi:hypothetical protein
MRRLLFLALAACGTNTFTSNDGGGTTPDATGDAITSSDASVLRCTGTFGAPHLFQELDGQGDNMGARIALDGLGVVFSRNTSSGGEIYAASRMGPKDMFSNLTPFGATVNTTDDEQWPSLVGTELYFSRRNASVTGIFVTTGANFTNPMPVTPNLAMSGVQNYAPYVLPGATAMYFTRLIGTQTSVMRMEHLQMNNWAAPVEVTSLEMPPAQTYSAAVTPDELRVFFASDRSGSNGADVWTSTRKANSDGWGQPTRVDAVSSSDDDIPTWISPDECTLLLQRRTSGNMEIFYALRTN